MIYEGSRYANAPVIRTPSSDGRVRPTVYPLVPPPVPARYKAYAVMAGERMDTIAYRLWGDPEMWWRIADANPEIFYPRDLTIGTILRIPL